MKSAPPCALSGLVSIADYATRHPEVFPSETSLRWFIRTRKHRLAKEGALVLLTGRLFIVADRFAAVTLQIGQEDLELSSSLAGPASP